MDIGAAARLHPSVSGKGPPTTIRRQKDQGAGFTGIGHTPLLGDSRPKIHNALWILKKNDYILRLKLIIGQRKLKH